jgi:hypothetical protein
MHKLRSETGYRSRDWISQKKLRIFNAAKVRTVHTVYVPVAKNNSG